jgi:hypothetical protein
MVNFLYIASHLLVDVKREEFKRSKQANKEANGEPAKKEETKKKK